MKGHMKGQMSMINLVALFIVEIMFLCILPVLNTFIQTTTVALNAGPQTEFTGDIIMVMGLMPLAIQVMIILTGIWIAIPQPQQGRY